MSPAYDSQLATNSPLVGVAATDVAPYYAFLNEKPAAGEASIAVPIFPDTQSSGPRNISFTFECPGGIGPGVFQIFESDDDTKGLAGYSAVAFGGASPGQVSAASFVTPGVGANTCKVTLTLRTRFVLIYCATAPSNNISVAVSA